MAKLDKKYKVKVDEKQVEVEGRMLEVKGQEEPILYLGIRESTRVLGFKHSQYTRRLLLEGKLDLPLEPRKVSYKSFNKWYIPLPSLLHYMENSRRTRGGERKYSFYFEREREDEVRAALDDLLGEDYKLELAYTPKEK